MSLTEINDENADHQKTAGDRLAAWELEEPRNRCGQNYILFIHRTSGARCLYRQFCKSWSCEGCLNYRKKKVLDHIKPKFDECEEGIFLTLEDREDEREEERRQAFARRHGANCLVVTQTHERLIFSDQDLSGRIRSGLSIPPHEASDALEQALTDSPKRVQMHRGWKMEEEPPKYYLVGFGRYVTLNVVGNCADRRAERAGVVQVSVQKVSLPDDADGAPRKEVFRRVEFVDPELKVATHKELLDQLRWLKEKRRSLTRRLK